MTLSFMPSLQWLPTVQMDHHLRPGLSRLSRSSPEFQTQVAAVLLLLHALKSGPRAHLRHVVGAGGVLERCKVEVSPDQGARPVRRI